jgi:hypothetical protein
LPLW